MLINDKMKQTFFAISKKNKSVHQNINKLKVNPHISSLGVK